MGQLSERPLRPHAFPRASVGEYVNVHSAFIPFPEHPWAHHVNIQSVLSHFLPS